MNHNPIDRANNIRSAGQTTETTQVAKVAKVANIATISFGDLCSTPVGGHGNLRSLLRSIRLGKPLPKSVPGETLVTLTDWNRIPE